MLYTIVEHFKDQDPLPIYRRFEVYPVMSSEEAAEKVAARL